MYLNITNSYKILSKIKLLRSINLCIKSTSQCRYNIIITVHEHCLRCTPPAVFLHASSALMKMNICHASLMVKNLDYLTSNLD